MTDQIKFANDKSAGEKLVGIDFNPSVMLQSVNNALRKLLTK